MPVLDLRYMPGTSATPQHTKSSELSMILTDNVHFPNGSAQKIPEFINTTYTDQAYGFDQTCRSQWTSLLNGLTGAYTLFGCYERLYCLHNGVLYNITPLQTTAAATLGSNPLSVTSGSPDIDVTYTAHGLDEGDRIKLSGATATGGIPAGDINIEHIVQGVIDANTFTITAATDATSTATGGGASVQIFLQIAGGNENMGTATGYGAGLYGSGIYGAYRVSAASRTFPRIWSFDNYGSQVVMCPGDYTAGDGQKIYIWDGDTDVAPTVLTNAPTDCIAVMVINNRVVALREQNIAIADLFDATVWSGDGFNSIDVQRSWKLIGGYHFGQKQAVIFAPFPWLLTVGGASADLEELSAPAIASPMAGASYRDAVVWYGEDGNFHAFDGGSPRLIENTQNGQDVLNNVNYGASYHMFMVSDPVFDQVWLYYPRGNSVNCSDYVIWKNAPDGNHFTQGELQRNSAQRPAMINRQFLMTSEQGIFSHYLLSQQQSSNAWAFQTSYFYAGDGDRRMELNDIWPDMYLSGNVTLTVYSKEYPQDTETEWGSYTLTPTMKNMTLVGGGKLISLKFSGVDDVTFKGAKLDVALTGRAY